MSTSLSWWLSGFDLPEGDEPQAALDWSIRHLVLIEGRTAANTWFEQCRADLSASLGRQERRRLRASPPRPSPPNNAELIPCAVSVGDRHFVLLDGILVAVHDDMAETVAVWLGATDGNAEAAEATMNHVHLWDLKDAAACTDEFVEDRAAAADNNPSAARRELDETLAIAFAWQRGLDSEPLGVPLCIAVDDGGPYGPEVTATRVRLPD